MQTLRTTFTLLAVLSLGLVAWVGCDSTGTMTGGDGDVQGRFTLRLTDAPAAIDSAVVTVDRVDLVAADADDDDMDDEDNDDEGNDDEGDDEGDDDGDGIITLTDSTRQIDLLRLQNGVTTTLADVTVPEGTYTQLRFVLGGENYLVVNGQRQTLKVPSGMQTGIKIILPQVDVENEGDQISVTLDFDVEESLIRAGRSGKYIFKPTIKVQSVSENGEDVQTVEVDGTVSSVNAGEETVRVDSIPFAITGQTEFDGDNGTSSLADLQAGQIVEVEGTIRDDGSLVALEIDVEDDDEVERSITARIESLGEDTLTLLGVTIEATSSTDFDDDLDGLDELQEGDRVEVEYAFSGEVRTATKIEREAD